MIIGICGHLGSGKTTVCQSAVDTLPGFWKRIGFSDPLYEIMLAMGIPEYIVYDKAQWNEPLADFGDLSARFICKSIGTWGRNEINVDIWARHAINRATERPNCITVIDNVRRLNEARAVLDAGGTLIAFDRAGLEPDLTHESEAEIPHIQRNMCATTFMNNGHDLKLAVKQFREMLLWLVKSAPSG